MKIVRGLPPNYEEIAKTLGPTEHTCFTYGDTLYVPSLPEGQEVPAHLLIHEEIHVKQQGSEPDEWWNKYLADAEFRLAQELEAYGAQYAYIRTLKDGDDKIIRAKYRKNALEALGKDLSSPVYGSILSWPEAMSKIRNASKAMIQ